MDTIRQFNEFMERIGIPSLLISIPILRIYDTPYSPLVHVIEPILGLVFVLAGIAHLVWLQYVNVEPFWWYGYVKPGILFATGLLLVNLGYLIPAE